MLPNLRIILAAVFATCAAVLALSAGMLGARDPDDNLSGVPEISRALVRQAIVAEPDRQFQLLAYSRRADELLRLRDLPVTPARAVVDYAEHAQARATETASATAEPAATSPTESAAAAPAAPTATADAPAAPAVDSAGSATPPTDAPATVAMAPVANLHGDTIAAPPVPAVTAAPVTPPPADTPPAPADAAAAPAPNDAPPETAAPPAPALAASGDTRVAAVEPGGGSATAEMYGPDRPKTDAKPHHRAKVARPHPPKAKKKVQVATGNTRPAPSTASSTGAQVNQPNNLNNGFGGWRYDSTAR